MYVCVCVFAPPTYSSFSRVPPPNQDSFCFLLVSGEVIPALHKMERGTKNKLRPK